MRDEVAESPADPAFTRVPVMRHLAVVRPKGMEEPIGIVTALWEGGGARVAWANGSRLEALDELEAVG